MFLLMRLVAPEFSEVVSEMEDTSDRAYTTCGSCVGHRADDFSRPAIDFRKTISLTHHFYILWNGPSCGEVQNADAFYKPDKTWSWIAKNEYLNMRNGGFLKPRSADDLTLPEIAARVAFSTVLTAVVITAAFLTLRIIL